MTSSWDPWAATDQRCFRSVSDNLASPLAHDVFSFMYFFLIGILSLSLTAIVSIRITDGRGGMPRVSAFTKGD